MIVEPGPIGAATPSATERYRRRVTRVAEAGGEVPWETKLQTLRRFVADPALHLAVYRCLYDSNQMTATVGMKIDQRVARDMLDALAIPADTPGLHTLKVALEAGDWVDGSGNRRPRRSA